jgi:chemotaxis methyl-accepting protein methylase
MALEDWQVSMVRDLVAHRSGLYLGQPHHLFLERTVTERMRETSGDFSSYLSQLQASPPGGGELQVLVERLCIHETSFMRDPSDFRALANYILPRLAEEVREHGRRRLRLVSAGCSTGQEAYSIAMVVEEASLGLPDVRIEVVGLDLSSEALERARRGLYSRKEVMTLEPWRLQRFFQPCGDDYEIVPSLRQKVRFMNANLASDLPITQVDVIFCRNVLIYFSPSQRYAIVRTLLAVLRLGGYLILGSADSVSAHRDVLEPVRTNGAVVFRRVRGLARAAAADDDRSPDWKQA